MKLFDEIRAFFTDAEHKAEAEIGAVHAAIASLGRRVEALEAAAKAKVEAAVTAVEAEAKKL